MENSVPFIRKLSNLILYSSVWIGACAAALVTFTYDITGSGIGLDPYVGFVFCGTLVLYAIHRLTGIERVKQYAFVGRFSIIREHRTHIIAYGLIGVIGSLWFMTHLPTRTIFWLILPSFFSFMYVFPVGTRRWRDYHLVKIFLVSAVWATLTGLVPFIHIGHATWSTGSMLFFERACFIFAITIPFDIRDISVDHSTGLKTLPMVIGVRGAKLLAITILIVSAILTFALIRIQVYDTRLVYPYLFCILITASLIWFSRTEHDDHYYSGLLDGTMFLLAFAYWLYIMYSNQVLRVHGY